MLLQAALCARPGSGIGVRGALLFFALFFLLIVIILEEIRGM